MKLIDKSALVAEIEKLKGKVDDGSSYCNGWQHALHMLEIEINTIEVKEVDLEKELDSMITPELKFHKALPSLFDVAKHFFELGLSVNSKTQKGEEV